MYITCLNHIFRVVTVRHRSVTGPSPVRHRSVTVRDYSSDSYFHHFRSPWVKRVGENSFSQPYFLRNPKNLFNTVWHWWRPNRSGDWSGLTLQFRLIKASTKDWSDQKSQRERGSTHCAEHIQLLKIRLKYFTKKLVLDLKSLWLRHNIYLPGVHQLETNIAIFTWIIIIYNLNAIN